MKMYHTIRIQRPPGNNLPLLSRPVAPSSSEQLEALEPSSSELPDALKPSNIPLKLFPNPLINSDIFGILQYYL